MRGCASWINAFDLKLVPLDSAGPSILRLGHMVIDGVRKGEYSIKHSELKLRLRFTLFN